MSIAILGASGKVGRALVASLRHDGHDVVGIGRRADRLHAPYRVADFANQAALRAALSDFTHVVSCAHARAVPAILPAVAADVERVVLMGSTRRFSKFPDVAAREVEAAEAAFVESQLPGTMLHPTMIYGAEGENNLQRVAAYLQRVRLVPLPLGGRSLVQPIHVDDVVRCLRAAIFRSEAVGASIVIAGPTALTYRTMIEAIGATIGRRPIIVSLPVRPLIWAAPLTRLLPGIPTIRSAELRRLLEDKAFDIDAMRARLDIEPVSFEFGLSKTFAVPSGPTASQQEA